MVNMLPEYDSDWRNIYDDAFDPFTETIDFNYLFPILSDNLRYYNDLNQPVCIVLFNILNMVVGDTTDRESSNTIRNIICNIKRKLLPEDIIFYDSKQTILILFPKTSKENVKKILEDIEVNINNLYINNFRPMVGAGYAEYPTDADSAEKLEKCAEKALDIAIHSEMNRIVGYFKERRMSKRIPVQIEVRCICEDAREFAACGKNISGNGIMLGSIYGIPVPDYLDLSFILPNKAKTKIVAKAHLVWKQLLRHKNIIYTGFNFGDVCGINARGNLNEFVLSH